MATAQQPGSPQAPKLDFQNPWPGLAAYDESSKDFFHGRARESAELLRLVRLAPLTALYSKSGLGKSSLLQAGLFPLLRAEHFLPVYVRLDFTDGARPPLDQIRERLGEELQAAHADHPELRPGESVWEYLHRAGIELWSADNFPLVPVIVLDQFEELFSRGGGKAELVRRVFDGLADLIENRIPAELAAEGAASKRAGLDLFSQRYRVVLSFREDFLPLVKTWEPKVPSLLRNYLRLEPLTRANAVDVVERAGRDVLVPGVAAVIVDFVAKDPASQAAESEVTVEPVLLSLCCARLNGKRRAGARIDESLILAEGRGIMEGFYREALTDEEVKGPPDVASFIEDYLIQGDHFRGDYPRDEALADGHLTAAQLAALTDKHRLLRVVSHPDTTRIELVHDRLVSVVRASRDARKAREKAEALELEAREARERAEERERAANELRRVLRRTRRWAVVALALAVLAGVQWFRAKRESERAVRASEQATDATTRATEHATRAEQQAAIASFRALTTSAVEQSRLDPELATLLGLRAMSMAEALDATTHDTTAVREAANALSRVTDAMRLRSSRKVCDRIQDASFDPGHGGPVVDCDDGAQHALAWPTLGDAPPRVHATGWFSRPRFSPDGKYLASLDKENVIHVVRTDSDDEEWRVKAPGQVNDLALGPGGDLLAAGGAPRAWIWRRDSATPRVLAGHRKGQLLSSVTRLVFSRSGALLATGAYDHVIRLWDAKSGRELGALLGHTDAIESLKFSPDDALLLSGSQDKTARVWDVRTKRGRTTLRGHANSVFDTSFSEDGRKIVTGSADGTVRLWDAESGRELVRLPAHAGPVAFARFVERDRQVVSGGWDGKVKTWRADGHTGAIERLRFDPDSHFVATASTDGTVRLWDTATGEETRVLAGGRAPLSALAIAARGSRLAAGDTEGRVRVWDAGTGEEIVEFCCQRDAIVDLEFSPDGAWLAAAAGSGGVLLMDVKQRTARSIQQHVEYNSNTVAFSADGKWIASTTLDGTLWLWNAIDPGEPRRVPAHLNQVFTTRFSPDCSALLTASQDGFAKLIDVQSGDTRVALPHPRLVMDGVFLHGGAQLLTATIGGEVLAWDAGSGAKAPGPPAHAGKVQLDVSKDGSRVATFSWDRTARVWDTRTWREIATFTHAEPVDGGAISPDGKHLATFTPYDVRITPIDADEVTRLARSRVSRELTREECHKFVQVDCGRPADVAPGSPDRY